MNTPEIKTPMDAASLAVTVCDSKLDAGPLSLFEHHAKKTPQKIAVSCNEQAISYEQLNIQANRLANTLSQRQLAGKTCVVFLSPGIDTVVSILALLKAGITYVPVDPDFPSARLEILFSQLLPEVVLTHSDLVERISAFTKSTCLLVDLAHNLNNSSDQTSIDHNLNINRLATEPAYVFFTSGTTGEPKGVVGSVKNLNHFIGSAIKQLGLCTQTHMLSVAKFTFSISLFELLAPLCAGGQITLLNREQVLNTPFLLGELAKVNSFHFSPTLLRKLFREIDQQKLASTTFDHVIHASTGGDLIPLEMLQKLRSTFTQADVFSVYGCSEVAVMGCHYPVRQTEHLKRTPVGRPFANTEIKILDEDQMPLPAEEKGEIYFSGPGVSAGYLNNSKLTQEKFVELDGKTFYRTGDIGVLDEQGDLVVLGRSDFQVKISGVRIELGELDAHLRKLTGVADALSSAQTLGEDGALSIIAFIVADGSVSLNTDLLMAELRQQIPGHMLPAGFVELDALPLNINLKADRKALPIVSFNDFIASRLNLNDEELDLLTQLCPVLQNTTNKTITARQQDLRFTALGFDSLDMMRTKMAVATHFELELSFGQLLEQFNTPAKLCRAIAIAKTAPEKSAGQNSGQQLPKPEGLFCAETAPNSKAQIGFNKQGKADWYWLENEVWHNAREGAVKYDPTAKGSPEAIVPLSPEQMEIWLSCQQNINANRAYNLAFELRVNSSRQREQINHALTLLSHKHQLLRSKIDHRNTAFYIENSIKLQTQAVESEQELQAFCDREFDLSQAPLWRVAICDYADPTQAGSQQLRLVIVFHHIIADGWAVDLVAQQLTELLASGNTALKDSIDYTQWLDQHHQRLQYKQAKSLKYWIDQYQSPPEPLELPTSSPRPSERTYESAYTQFELDHNSREPIRQACERLKTTEFGYFYAVFALLINRITTATDFTIGVPLAGQLLSGGNDLIAHDVRTLPLRHKINNSNSVSGWVANISQQLATATDNGYLSYGALLPHIEIDRADNRPPLVSLIFTQDPTEHSYGQGETELTLKALPRRFETFDLWLNLVPSEQGISLEAQFNRNIFSENLVQAWLHFYQELLLACASGATRSLKDLPTLSSRDLQQLQEWNNTDEVFEQEQTLADLFFDQVSKTPDAIALEYQSQTLSYSAFAQKALQVSNYLTDQGVKPGESVGVFCDRSLEMLISIYGIICAGAVYVPLDPDHPPERLKYIIESSESSVVLSSGKPYAAIMSMALPVKSIDIATILAVSSAPLPLRPLAPISPTDEAYIIYTSGSTGQPKGVVNCHNGIVNRLLWAQKTFSFGTEDRALLKTPYSFDVSLWELFFPLHTGARLVIAPPGAHKDPRQLEEIIVDKQITRIHFVPSMLNEFLSRKATQELPLVSVTCSGEALPASLRELFFNRYPEVELHNLYGPTEAAVEVTHWQCTKQDTSPVVPIGYPISNTQIHIVNNNKLVPIGSPGELIIAGVQVAKGYKNKEQLTQEKFPADFVNPQQPYHVYHTGDLARWTPDGHVEYLGRLDFQVKIRGLRIELGEIETLLEAHPSIEQAAVIVNSQTSAQGQLVGFYRGDIVAQQEFKDYLSLHLPAYMVPQRFERLSKFPLTTSGKTDRKELAKIPIAQADSKATVQIPQTDEEMILSQVWADVLHLEHVSRTDDFFDIGGHSLAAIRVITKIREIIGVDLSLNTFLKLPKLKDMAHYISETPSEADTGNCILLKEGTGPALFCLYGVLLYKSLADALPQDQTVYGVYLREEITLLKNNDPSAYLEAYGDLASIANKYKKAIQEQQAEGPYFLSGESFGGIVAIEVARLLQAEGHEVKLLGVMDSWMPYEFARLASGINKLKTNLRVLVSQPSAFVDKLSKKFSNKNNTPVAVDTPVNGPVVDPNVGDFRQHTRELVIRDYKPNFYQGKMLLFVAQDKDPFEPSEPSLGWKRYVSELTVVPLAGDHLTILQSPNVEVMAEHIGQQLLAEKQSS